MAVVTKNVELPDAEGLYDFCKGNWKEKPQPGPCQHYGRNFFLTTEIRRPKDTTTNTLQGTRQIHSIRSVGLEGLVEIRHSSCFCINCKLGTGACSNNHLVLQWERKQLLGGKLNDATINHWEKVYECDVQHKIHPVSEGKSKPTPTPTSREKIGQKRSVQNGTRLCPQCFVAAKSQNNQSVQNGSSCDVWARLSTNVAV